jgi:proteasome accessory factor B
VSARKSERLLNLLIALLVSRGYVDKHRLREVIPDYREAGSDEAFEKMFERDKEDLRALGVPIETGGFDPLFGDEAGYRVPRQAFELPEIDLEADEAAVIGLAARVWQQAGLASATSDALRKLKAAGIDVDRSALDVAHPQVVPDEPAFETFWEAVATRRPVRFRYRAARPAGDPDGLAQRATGEPAVRRLHPWGVVSYRSRWYVVGHDLDRDGERLFRLSRVVGTPVLDGPPGSYEVPPGTDLRATAARLAPDTPARTAVLLARADKAVGLRHRARVVGTEDGPDGRWDRLEVGFGRLDAMASEVLGHGADVLVEAPDDLRDAVVARLEQLVPDGVA